MRKIGGDIFIGCTNLKTVIFKEGIKELTTIIFSGCTSLTELTLPNSLKTLSLSVFNGTGVTHIVLPKDLITLQGRLYSENAVSITIPKSMTTLDYLALYQAKNLTDIYYEGTREEWEKITINRTFIPSQFDTEETIAEKKAALLAWEENLTIHYNG